MRRGQVLHPAHILFESAERISAIVLAWQDIPKPGREFPKSVARRPDSAGVGVMNILRLSYLRPIGSTGTRHANEGSAMWNKSATPTPEGFGVVPAARMAVLQGGKRYV